MKAQQAIEELRLETQGDSRGWSAEAIEVGRLRMKRVICHDRGGCLNLIDTLGEMLVRTRRVRLTAAQSSGVLSVRTSGPTKLLTAAIARYLKDLALRGKNQATIDGYEAVLLRLLAVSGDIQISRISADHIRELWEAIRWVPRGANANGEYKHLPFWEQVAAGKAESVPAPSVHVYNSHWRTLRAFFRRMIKLKEMDESPLEGLDLEIDVAAEPRVRRAFTDAELRRLFDPKNFLPWALEYPHRFWIPQISLYTGARANELAQLKVRDVSRENGRWLLRIQKTFDEGARNSGGPRTTRQKTKSLSAVRTIPIAKPLIDAGFVDYVEDIKKTGHPRLFPHLRLSVKKNGQPSGRGYSPEIVRQFSVYAKGLGIESGVALHAFRHTIVTALDTARIPDSVQAALTGHEEAVYNPGLKNYQHRSTSVDIDEVEDALRTFKPCVKLLPYKRGMFREQLRDGWRFQP